MAIFSVMNFHGSQKRARGPNIKKVLAHVLFQILCLLGISFLSDYKIPDLSETTWDSALFLTPIGILKNYINESPVLRSFYGDLSKGQTALTSWQIALITVVLVVQIINFTKLVKVINR